MVQVRWASTAPSTAAWTGRPAAAGPAGGRRRPAPTAAAAGGYWSRRNRSPHPAASPARTAARGSRPGGIGGRAGPQQRPERPVRVDRHPGGGPPRHPAAGPVRYPARSSRAATSGGAPRQEQQPVRHRVRLRIRRRPGPAPGGPGHRPARCARPHRAVVRRDAAAQHQLGQQPPGQPDAQRTRLQQRPAAGLVMRHQVQVIGDQPGTGQSRVHRAGKARSPAAGARGGGGCGHAWPRPPCSASSGAPGRGPPLLAVFPETAWRELACCVKVGQVMASRLPFPACCGSKKSS